MGSLSNRDILRFDLIFLKDLTFVFLRVLVERSEAAEDVSDGASFRGRPGRRF